MKTYQIKDLEHIVITINDIGVFFVPLTTDSHVYNLKGIEAQIFKAIYSNKNKTVDNALSIFLKDNHYEKSELQNFTQKLLKSLAENKLIGLCEVT